MVRHAPVLKKTGFFPKHDPDAIIKKNQIKKLANSIPNNCTWYVSPLKRTFQTAKALSKYLSYSKIIYENEITEQNFGDWSGKKITEIWKIIKKNEPKHNFSFISPEITPPNGESFLNQFERVKLWLEKLRLKEGENILLITHAGTIRSVISHALKIKPEYGIGIEILHQKISVIEMFSKKFSKYKGGRFRLISLNKES